MGRAAGVLAALLAATVPAANAATSIFVENARLGDPTPVAANADERARYDHQSFDRSVGLHTIVAGEGVVIAIRGADAANYEKLSIGLPALGASFEGPINGRYVAGSGEYAFAPDDVESRNPTGRMSIKRVDDLLVIDLTLAFDVVNARPPAGRASAMDCEGHGKARRVDRDRLTPFFGAPVDFQHKYSAIRAGDTSIEGAAFDLRCEWRRAKQ